jgi:hypothetical protein
MITLPTLTLSSTSVRSPGKHTACSPHAPPHLNFFSSAGNTLNLAHTIEYPACGGRALVLWHWVVAAAVGDDDENDGAASANVSATEQRSRFTARVNHSLRCQIRAPVENDRTVAVARHVPERAEAAGWRGGDWAARR